MVQTQVVAGNQAGEGSPVAGSPAEGSPAEGSPADVRSLVEEQRSDLAAN